MPTASWHKSAVDIPANDKSEAFALHQEVTFQAASEHIATTADEDDCDNDY